MSTGTAVASKEQVLTVRADTLEKWAGYFSNGCNKDCVSINKFFDQILSKNETYFIDREYAEHDENFKQIIPYVVFRKWNGDTFQFQRTKKSGETRLRGKRSVGVGGHINPYDRQPGFSDRTTFNNCINREIREELGGLIIPPSYWEYLGQDDSEGISQEPIGLLYDSYDEVGRVHVGVVYSITIHNDWHVHPIEDHLADAGFMTKDAMLSRIDEYERWSQIVIRNML